jgi:hypothetical protein
MISLQCSLSDSFRPMRWLKYFVMTKDSTRTDELLHGPGDTTTAPATQRCWPASLSEFVKPDNLVKLKCTGCQGLVNNKYESKGDRVRPPVSGCPPDMADRPANCWTCGLPGHPARTCWQLQVIANSADPAAERRRLAAEHVTSGRSLRQTVRPTDLRIVGRHHRNYAVEAALGQIRCLGFGCHGT